MFFSMFSPPKNQNMIQFARDRLMEDLRFTARHVRYIYLLLLIYPTPLFPGLTTLTGSAVLSTLPFPFYQIYSNARGRLID